MTIREKLLKMLFEHGLFEKQAAEVLSRYENSPAAEAMKDRMGDDEADYPPQVMAVIWIGVRAAAVEWIDEKKPQHWARRMFAD